MNAESRISSATICALPLAAPVRAGGFAETAVEDRGNVDSPPDLFISQSCIRASDADAESSQNLTPQAETALQTALKKDRGHGVRFCVH